MDHVSEPYVRVQHPHLPTNRRNRPARATKSASRPIYLDEGEHEEAWGLLVAASFCHRTERNTMTSPSKKPKKQKTPPHSLSPPTGATTTSGGASHAALIATAVKLDPLPTAGGSADVPPLVLPAAAPTPTPTASAPATGTSPAPQTAAAVAPPPSGDFPSAPDGYEPPPPRAFAGTYPSPRALAATAQAISDLSNFTDYTVTFGGVAPPAASISDALALELLWRAYRARVQAWAGYVETQYGQACKNATTLIEELKPFYSATLAKKPSLATEYQGLTELLDAPKVTAKQAWATRRAKTAKAKKETATAKAATVSPADSTPVTTTTKNGS
jgi:hypothetical protein